MGRELGGRDSPNVQLWLERRVPICPLHHTCFLLERLRPLLSAGGKGAGVKGQGRPGLLGGFSKESARITSRTSPRGPLTSHTSSPRSQGYSPRPRLGHCAVWRPGLQAPCSHRRTGLPAAAGAAGKLEAGRRRAQKLSCQSQPAPFFHEAHAMYFHRPSPHSTATLLKGFCLCVHVCRCREFCSRGCISPHGAGSPERALTLVLVPSVGMRPGCVCVHEASLSPPPDPVAGLASGPLPAQASRSPGALVGMW